MSRPVVAAVALAAVALAAVAIAGCGSGADDAGASGTTTIAGGPPIHAVIQKSRVFEAQHKLELVLRDDDREVIVLDTLQLRSPLFTRVPDQVRHSELQPGRAVRMPIDYGAPVCGAELDAAREQPTTLVVTIEGEHREVPLVPDPANALTRLNRQQCGVQEVFDAADIGFGDDLTPSGPYAVETTLEIDRGSGDHEVQVDEVRSSIIFTLEAAGGGPPAVAIEPGTDHDVERVTFNASRCDSHALTESKKSFTFAAFVRLDGAPPIRVDLVTDGRLRETLKGFLEACH